MEEAETPDGPEDSESESKEYATVTSNPLTPPVYNQQSTTVEASNDTSANYIDTSIPVAHPDVGMPSYETVDQIKYKINQEIKERTHSPALGPEFIIYAA